MGFKDPNAHFFFWHSSSTDDLLPPGFPNIDMGPQLKVVERTRTATMLCAASGNPDPEITWYKDFLPIDPSASNGRIKQLRSGKRSWNQAALHVFPTANISIYSGLVLSHISLAMSHKLFATR